MKKNRQLLIIASILIGLTSNSQESQQRKIEKLTQGLNTSVAPIFLVELKNNKGLVKIDQFTKALDLRDNYAIAQDSMLNIPITGLNTGHDGGHVFWKFDFQSITNSNVVFKATKNQQIFCTILFKEQDTISLKSKLNIYTSHHKTSDSSLHTVQWLGDKYISLLLTPKWVDNNIQMEVRGITISGKFQRRDRMVIAKNFTKAFRKILRREFEKLFESEEMSKLLSHKLKS